MPTTAGKKQGLVKVVLSGTKNPSKSPFTKGDFQFPALEKERGVFGQTGLGKSIHYGETHGFAKCRETG
jgi:hypothetical protein